MERPERLRAVATSPAERLASARVVEMTPAEALETLGVVPLAPANVANSLREGPESTADGREVGAGRLAGQAEPSPFPAGPPGTGRSSGR